MPSPGLTRLGPRRQRMRNLPDWLTSPRVWLPVPSHAPIWRNDGHRARGESSRIGRSLPSATTKVSAPRGTRTEFPRSSSIRRATIAHPARGERVIVVVEERPPPFERTPSCPRSVQRRRRAGGAGRVRRRAHAAEAWRPRRRCRPSRRPSRAVPGGVRRRPIPAASTSARWSARGRAEGREQFRRYWESAIDVPGPHVDRHGRPRPRQSPAPGRRRHRARAAARSTARCCSSAPTAAISASIAS